ncbi:MAG: hypothetical protein ABI207_05160 [Crocinitomicaceae bacterium]
MEEPEKTNAKGDYRLAYIAISALGMFFGFRLSVYNSFGYNQSYNYMFGAVLSIGSSAFFLIYVFDLADRLKNNSDSKVLAIPFAIIMILYLFVLDHYSDKYIHDELKSYGKYTVAKVIDFETVLALGRGSHNQHYATIEYYYGKKRIIQKVSNEDDEYEMNQSVKIIFSKEEPEMFMIIEAE